MEDSHCFVSTTAPVEACLLVADACIDIRLTTSIAGRTDQGAELPYAETWQAPFGAEQPVFHVQKATS